MKRPRKNLIKEYGQCPICEHGIRVYANLRKEDVVFTDSHGRNFHRDCVEVVITRMPVAIMRPYYIKFIDIFRDWEQDDQKETEDCARPGL